MKKLLPLLLITFTILGSCKKDPVPVEIRSYVLIHSLLKDSFALTWSADDVDVPYEQDYGDRILGAVLIDDVHEEIFFAVKNADSGELIETFLLDMEMNTYYLVILYGTADDPILVVEELDTSRPQDGYAGFRFLHVVPTLDSVDVYMGGTELTDRKVTDMSYTEFSDRFEVYDYVARTSVIVAIHGDTYDPDKEVLNDTYIDPPVLAGFNYLSILGYAVGDTADTDLKLWLYDLPAE